MAAMNATRWRLMTRLAEEAVGGTGGRRHCRLRCVRSSVSLHRSHGYSSVINSNVTAAQFPYTAAMAVASPRCLAASETHTTPIETSVAASPLTQEDLNRIAAYKAVDEVRSGMVVGIGTGSTARHTVERIAHLLNQGELEGIVGVPTSMKTREQAAALDIALSDLDSHPAIDLTIDGADEVDPDLYLVKGQGGSLLREKMIESASRWAGFMIMPIARTTQGEVASLMTPEATPMLPPRSLKKSTKFR